MDKKTIFITVFLSGVGAIMSSFFLSPFTDHVIIVAIQAIVFSVLMYGVYRLLDIIFPNKRPSKSIDELWNDDKKQPTQEIKKMSKKILLKRLLFWK